MKFFIALSANILITAIVVFLCYAAAEAPTPAYLVAGLAACFLSACYLSRKVFAKPLWQTLGFGILSIEFSGFVMCRLLFRRIQSCRAKMFQ